jgi:hypothetical protein
MSNPESANGHIDSLRDMRLWIADSPSAKKQDAILAEITPRWQETLNIEAAMLSKFASQKKKARVTGWIMWDEEHPTEVGRSRASQWEIHPVTSFEKADLP